MIQHRIVLRLGKHHSHILQDAWNQYGEDTFTFDVLEIVPNTAMLLELEQRYLDERQPQYNSAKIALRNAAGITSDPQRAEKAAEARIKGALVMMQFTEELQDEIQRLQHIIDRDDDVMKVLSVARSLTPQERRFIDESADLAEIFYAEGIVSGKQFLALVDRMAEHRQGTLTRRELAFEMVAENVEAALQDEQ